MSQSCDRITYGLRKKGFFVHIIHFTNRKDPFKTDNQENGAYTAIPVAESEAHSANLGWNFIEQHLALYDPFPDVFIPNFCSACFGSCWL